MSSRVEQFKQEQMRKQSAPSRVEQFKQERLNPKPAQTAPISTPKKEAGTGQKIVQSIAKPFLRGAVTLGAFTAGIGNFAQALGNKITGNEEAKKKNLAEAKKALNPDREYSVGWLGKVKPAAFKDIGKGAGKSFADAAGLGAELGAWTLGTGAAKNAASQGVKQFAVKSAKRGAAVGAATGLGSSLQKEKATVGSVLKDTAIGAGSGAAFGALISPITRSLSKGAQNSAEKSMSKALGATTKGNKTLSERVVPELVKRKTVALSRNSLYNKADKAADIAGEKVDDAFKSLPKDATGNWAPVLQKLELSKNALKVNGQVLDKEKYKAIESIQKELTGVAREASAVVHLNKKNVFTRLTRGEAKFLNDEVKNVVFSGADPVHISQVSKVGDKIPEVSREAAMKLSPNAAKTFSNIPKEANDVIPVSVESIRKARQILDGATGRATKTFGITGEESTKLAVRKEAANAIRNELAKEFPNIDRVNKEFNFWNNVKTVVGDTIKRTQSQTSLSGELATDTGAIVGATMKGTVGSVVTGALAMKFVKQAVQSTAWRTTSAVIKSSLAESLAKGDYSKAIVLLQKIIDANQVQK